MTKRHITFFSFCLVLIATAWWVKHQVDAFIDTAETKLGATFVTPALMKRDTPVQAPKLPTRPQPEPLPSDIHGEAADIMNKMLVRFNVGDYRAALNMAHAAERRPDLGPEFMAWLERQIPVLLTAVAWLEIKRGNCQEALGYLQQAYVTNRDEPVTKGLAFCHYRLKNWISAEEFAKQYLQKEPNDADVIMLYADTLESEQRFQEAAEQLQKLVTQDPGNEELIKAFSSMQEKAKESVRQVALASRYIALTYRAGEHEDIADFVIDTLDRAVEEFVDRFGFAEPKDQIEVYLYAGDNFQSLVSNGPDWAAGIFDGRMRIPIYDRYLTVGGRDALKRILRHELVHALFAIQTDMRELPSWFNEGVAQRLECKERCQGSLFPPNPGVFLPPEDLNKPYTSYKRLKAERSYRQSLYLIYVLESDTNFGARDNLARIIERITRQTDLSSDGLLEPVGITFKTLHSRGAQAWQRGNQFKEH